MKTTKRFWLTALVALVVGTISFFVPSWLMSAQDETIAIIGGVEPPSYLLLAINRCGSVFVLIAAACGVVAVLSLLLWLYHALTKPTGLRKTSVLSVFLGTALSFGFYCFLIWAGLLITQAAFGDGTLAAHPYELPGSTIGLFAAFTAVAVLIWRFVAQKSTVTVGAKMADLLLVLVSGTLTFPLWQLAHNVCSWVIASFGW